MQDSVRTLNEVVVTATKFAKKQVETCKVLTVIDQAQLQRSTGKDISQLLNEQVGLVINGANSNSGKDKSVFLGGTGSQYTLILLDGIPVNNPSGVGGVFDLRLLPVDQVERSALQ
jgi:vitamin B12 transporter